MKSSEKNNILHGREPHIETVIDVDVTRNSTKDILVSIEMANIPDFLSSIGEQERKNKFSRLVLSNSVNGWNCCLVVNQRTVAKLPKLSIQSGNWLRELNHSVELADDPRIVGNRYALFAIVVAGKVIGGTIVEVVFQ